MNPYQSSSSFIDFVMYEHFIFLHVNLSDFDDLREVHALFLFGEHY